MTVDTHLEDMSDSVAEIARGARKAAAVLALADTAAKNNALKTMAAEVRKARADILKANALDVEKSVKNGQKKAFVDRLTLDEARVEGMAKGLEEMAALPDPIGEVLREWTRPNGILIKQVRVPLGVIGMIYESRPNVTIESAGLCLKAGNAVILRGGSEAFNTNTILVQVVGRALTAAALPKESAQLLPPHDRRTIRVLSNLTGDVDLIIARGSEEMIKDVSANATVPVLGHGKGVCHVYVDDEADIAKAVEIAFNSKVQRPGVCNAMETLLVHEHVMYDLLPKIAQRYISAGVEMRGDDRARGLVSHMKEATDEDWATEYSDKIVSIKVVDSSEEAIDHINRYGSRHTDAIVTENKKKAAHFEKAVDSSCVVVNASTRLHDGGVFGFGSEIGISTQKLHARGTMGLKELTTTKYLVEGNGQIRE